jgi:hypothetical protein
LVAVPTNSLGADPLVDDAFSSDVVVRAADGWYQTPVHAALTPDGRVLLWGIGRPSWPPVAPPRERRAAWILTPSAPGASLPAEVTATALTQAVDIPGAVYNGLHVRDDLFCAGHTWTADGKHFIAGGTRSFADVNGAPRTVLGLPYANSFDPQTTAFTRVPGNMLVAGATGLPARWYPTTTRLPDKRILVTGGFDRIIPYATYNWSTELYDPSTGERAVGSPYGTTPQAIANRDYTHTFVLPSPSAPFDLLMIGEDDVPVLNSTKDFGRWSTANPMRPGAAGMTDPGVGQSSAMLMLRVSNGEWGYTNGSVAVVGGTYDTALMSRADVFDPFRKTWRTVETGTMRHHPTTITLPDGRVLILAGHEPDADEGLRRAQYVDPANGFSVSTGSALQASIRGYHAVSLLLPDGRVLLGGGRDSVTDGTFEKPSFQYYSPDYMFEPRPSIAAVPTQIGYRQMFPVVTNGPTPKEAVLVALGSMTHSFDQNQRVVQLPVGAVVPGANGAKVMIASGPSDEWSAPPGYYMLFAVDENRVPSVAKIVHVG